MLISSRGFNTADITTFLDGDATRDVILSTLQGMVNDWQEVMWPSFTSPVQRIHPQFDPARAPSGTNNRSARGDQLTIFYPGQPDHLIGQV